MSIYIYIYIYTRTKDKFDEPMFKVACIWEEKGGKILQFCNVLISVNIYLSIYLSIYVSIYLPIILSEIVLAHLHI